MLFTNPDVAPACKAYMSSAGIHGANAASPDSISLRSIEFGTAKIPEHALRLPPLYAVVYPPQLSGMATLFWRLTGTGVSSRQAGRCLQALDRIRQADGISQPPPPVSHPVYETICNRIARLIERAPVGRSRSSKVSPNAVYLYPSGMSAIYHVHHLLLNWRGAESVVLGFTYELTIKIIEVFGPSYRLYSGGTDTEIDELEHHIEGRYRQESKIQAVWCECPSNPLLRTPNMERLRELADKYEFVVVVDDTIGTFANVDVLSIADIVVTSLTKWFNGFADVLAGW
jgi:cystathionine gamma-synthase